LNASGYPLDTDGSGHHDRLRHQPLGRRRRPPVGDSRGETYLVDGVRVSNFVLPLYFTSNQERGGRNDFLGTIAKGKTLQSFSANPGGYIGFYDPKRGDDDTFSADERPAERLEIKARLKAGRGQLRRRRLVE
jgi:hypothetical protein